MAAITASVVGVAAVDQSRRQRRDAKRAARQQASGIQSAQEETRQASLEAMPFLEEGFAKSREDLIAGRDAARSELVPGFERGTGLIGKGFEAAQGTISPLAGRADSFQEEQFNLLGLGGDAARQTALSRISDPLQEEQERAFRRNVGAVGAPGGNVLSELAEQTRSRTEANLGQRLGQLQSAGTPALNALQQLSQLQLQRGLALGGAEQEQAANLANLETQLGGQLAGTESARAQALANARLGQGSQLAQLAQNLGTARAGGSAFAAQQANPLLQGLTTGLNVFTGAGGQFPQTNPFSGIGDKFRGLLGGNQSPSGGTFVPQTFTT